MTIPFRRMSAMAILVLVLGLTVSGCAESGRGTSLNDAPDARELAPTSTDFGNYVVHHNATTSDLLSPDDAAKYGITRSRSNALVNIVILKKDGSPGHTPIGGSVTAKTSNLTGQLKNVTLKEITEGDAVYFIGVVSVANNETLNFDITATPADSSDPLNVKFQQQFFTK
jgi:hypothetical protein